MGNTGMRVVCVGGLDVLRFSLGRILRSCGDPFLGLPDETVGGATGEKLQREGTERVSPAFIHGTASRICCGTGFCGG